ncbi:MAG: methyltransferase domain-containing protein [Acetobacteraceae bacterium]|nr:methyltransferase domain-containing protein [Acetobacteraceae bacterium]
MDGTTAPANLDRLFARTAEFIDAGRFGAARPLLAAINRFAPPSPKLAELNAVLALKEGRLTEARDSLDQAVLTWPERAGLRKCRADARRQLGDLVGAARDAAEAVVLDPHDSDAKAILGVALLGLGHAEDARACLAEAAAAQPANPLLALALSDAQLACGDDADAAATLANAIARLPTEAALRNAALLLAIRSQRLDEAVELAAAARRDGAVDACVFGLQGHALSSLGRHDEAAEAYAEARKLGPDDPYVRYLAAASGALPEPDRAPCEYVRAVFDGYAGRFESHLISLGYRVPGLLRAALLRHVEIDTAHALGPVLDLGCGTGLMAVALSDLPVAPITGIDISPRMLAGAEAKGLYAELREGDILSALDTDASTWHVVLAADLLCYFGALEEVMAAVRRRLAPGGLFLFSVETSEEAQASAHGWRLERLGRFTHGAAYLRRCATSAGFAVRELTPESLRQEAGVPVSGLIAALAAP